MNLLQLQNGCKAYGARSLFDQASFSVNADEHIGVIGPNGAGKTTLFRILIGEENLDSGQLIQSRELRLGYLSQHDEWEKDLSANVYLERKSIIPLWELKALGKELQLTEAILEQPISSLSGGYRMRIKLLGLLGQKPNLMLLDEPTNYLDLESTLALENFLQGYQGAFLLISHDREFLRCTTDHILEVEAGDMTKYNGNIDDYFEQKELLRSQQITKAAGVEQKRKEILDFVARFGAKATKARQAQSRLKSLAKLETIEIKPLPVQAKIKIPAPIKTGKIIVDIANANFGYGNKAVLNNVNLQILKGDHVAVVGLNGAGKSTLLKGISGQLSTQTGQAKLGLDVSLAFFAQFIVEALNPNHTVLESLAAAAHPTVLPQEILDLSGSLLFSGDDVNKKISLLSGGEKTRVALGRVLLKKSPCLVLDEPTNHLDFQTVEALTLALQNYEGTVIVVSHDRSFIKRIGTKILEVKNQAVELFPGTYEEYVWRIQKLALNQDSSPASIVNINPDKASRIQERENKKRFEKEIKQLDKKILNLESEMQRLQKENDEINQAIHEKLEMSLVEKLGKNSKLLSELEEEWLNAISSKEKFLDDKNT